MDTKDTKQDDIKTLVARVIDTFQSALIQMLSSIEKSHIWLVVTRFTLNKKELCDDDCDSEIHFHDSDDWFRADERRVLDEFWAKLKPRAKKKATTYIDELDAFAKIHGPELAKLIQTQTESTREFLETVINKDSKEFIESLLTEHVTKSFPFMCAVVCTLIDYHARDTEQERHETGWFDVFFQYFLTDQEDTDEDEDDDEDDDEEDDDDEDEDDEDEDDEDEDDEDDEDDDENDDEDEKDDKKESKSNKRQKH